MNRLVLWLGGVVVALALAVGAVAIIATSGGGGGGTPAQEGQPNLGPRARNELRIPGADPPTLDPHLATDAGSAVYIVEIFSGLVTIDPDLKVAPDIAESWETSADGKTYTFHLRSNAVFHNGQPVTAQTVKDSLERAADPKTQSPTASIYLGDIVGVKDKLRGRAQNVSGVKAVDDRTLQITIDAPKPYFIAKLTYTAAFVVDVKQIEANPRNWTRRPNGTGPFKLADWQIGQKLVLDANERFYKGPPKLARATFLLAGGSGITMYENNEIDAVGVGLNDIERVRDPNEKLNKEYTEAPNLDVYYVGFNVKQPPFDDAKVRQAFAMAVDKQSIAHVVLRDLVLTANGVLPPGMPGYSSDLKGLPYDKDRAKQLLRESKYGSQLPRITLTVSGEGATLGPSSEAMIQMWRDNLGVQIEVQQVEFSTFLQEVRRGRYQMFELGWIADYIDPEDFLDILFYSDSPQNESGYSNPQVDRLLEQARVEQDVSKRLAIYRQVEEIIVNDAPWIMLYHSKDAVLVKPYVKGYKPQPMVVPRLSAVSVER